MRSPRNNRREPEVEDDIFDKVVFINRCAKVVKGGRRFSFSALVVSGDQQGKVGIGYGKAKQVPEAIRKGTEQARKRMKAVPLSGDSIPHAVLGQAGGGKVLLRPASQGTGVIAGGGVRAVLEAVGIKNILSKSLGSNNQLAVVNATMDGLSQLRTAATIDAIRNSDQSQSQESSQSEEDTSEPVEETVVPDNVSPTEESILEQKSTSDET
ncbi:MAG: 30S ribosomal protein S5 [Opitutales bacterium]|nr:30S ribosomal protein S5 [Opitutales bacterium]|tara:strand:- start:66 stop:698 length:633 start_codon:yes stop_codon:yes gene_type:complete